MADTFQKTVNLKDKPASANRPASAPIQARQEPVSRATESNERKKNEAMDKIFGDEKSDIQKINRGAKRRDIDYTRYIWIFLLAVIVVASLSFFLNRKKDDNIPKETEQAVVEQWYSVKLVNGEIYYGEIGDTKADPVVIKNVYYDYDLLNKKEETTEGEKPAAGGLRLVKRGKESYGPDGTMSIVRGQVLFFEPLKEESKVLKAILENEKR